MRVPPRKVRAAPGALPAPPRRGVRSPVPRPEVRPTSAEIALEVPRRRLPDPEKARYEEIARESNSAGQAVRVKRRGRLLHGPWGILLLVVAGVSLLSMIWLATGFLQARELANVLEAGSYGVVSDLVDAESFAESWSRQAWDEDPGEDPLDRSLESLLSTAPEIPRNPEYPEFPLHSSEVGSLSKVRWVPPFGMAFTVQSARMILADAHAEPPDHLLGVGAEHPTFIFEFQGFSWKLTEMETEFGSVRVRKLPRALEIFEKAIPSTTPSPAIASESYPALASGPGDRTSPDTQAPSLPDTQAPRYSPVEEFIRARLKIEASRDIDSIMADYDETVNYWGRGTVDRDVIREEKLAYMHRWPEYQEDLQGEIRITSEEQALIAKFITRFRVNSPVRGVAIEGRQEATYVIREIDGIFKIVGENGRILEKREIIEGWAATAPSSTDVEEFPGERYPQTRLDRIFPENFREYSVEVIQYAINEMFARRGAWFNKEEVRRQFERFPWYRPKQGYDLNQIENLFFSDLERDNLKTLVQARDAAKRRR